jgi:ubiquinone/menaquinone biosynthesis C-methylase UbiE
MNMVRFHQPQFLPGEAVMAIEKSRNPAEFADFELAGWGANIAGYDQTFGRVSRQSVRPILDAAKVRSGMRVLDVCCGPGMLSQAAIGRGAYAIGLDFSAEVVDLARSLVPTGAFQRGDAQALQFPDNAFDAVVCGYGVIHVPEPEVALAEMFRVVCPGGRVAISVWDNTTPNNGFGLVYAAIRAHGKLDVPVPHGPDYFQFSTKEKMRAALTEIGFTKVETTFFDQQWHVESATQVLEALRKGTVRAGAVLAGQSETAMIGIHHFFEQTLNGLRNPVEGFDVPLPALIGSGAKP